jgi:hypothetical protein
MTPTRLSVALGVTALAAATLSSAWAGPAPARHTLPPFDPAAFAQPVANAYFPLTPGLVTRLHGTEGPEHFVEKTRVTHRTRLIAGVTTTVVRDVVRRPDGTLAETTDDWYADDDLGNVWYFGEDTATYDENGRLEDREGSWEAGKHGARPGIIMPAHAEPSTANFMEHAKGTAEDQAWVVQTLRRVTTPGGRFTDIVRTFEWSRLEPNVISQKFYAAGVGIIEERDVARGDEHFWVVSTHQA